jgi:hypothetical protein
VSDVPQRSEDPADDEEASPGAPREPFFGRPAHEVPLALSAWLRRWRVVLAIAFLSGCASAITLWVVAGATSWSGYARAVWFMAGLAGVIFGVRLTYGGRSSAGASREPVRHPDETSTWVRLRYRLSETPRPVIGAAVALFSAPIFVASLLV